MESSNLMLRKLKYPTNKKCSHMTYKQVDMIIYVTHCDYIICFKSHTNRKNQSMDTFWDTKMQSLPQIAMKQTGVCYVSLYSPSVREARLCYKDIIAGYPFPPPLALFFLHVGRDWLLTTKHPL